MNKKLNEMNLEELWKIFPIFLVEHNNEWSSWYEEEKENILSILPCEMIYRISHIGSTYIPTIWAKNIVDILLEIKSKQDLEYVKDRLLNNNWLCMNKEENRISLNKGYTEEGFAEKVFHLHIRLIGDNDELYFRDYLFENPKIAKDYENLKLSLWKKFEHNRDKYTESKGDFIKKYTEIAKIKYGKRY